jgi:hypothetical protein
MNMIAYNMNTKFLFLNYFAKIISILNFSVESIFNEIDKLPDLVKTFLILLKKNLLVLRTNID